MAALTTIAVTGAVGSRTLTLSGAAVELTSVSAHQLLDVVQKLQQEVPHRTGDVGAVITLPVNF